jgi:Fe-S cluster assembly iron-binding protein IscA
MLTVTERAREKLKYMLSSKVDNPEAALRLTTTEHGEFGLRVDVETPGDQVVKHKGVKVLVMDGKLAKNLAEDTLDVEYTTEGSELTLIKKNQ